VPAEVRLYDRLFDVPYPGARNPHGDRVDGGAAQGTMQHQVAVAGDDDAAADAVERNFLDDLNPSSKRVVTAYVEPALATAAPEARFQFERAGYFVADRFDHTSGKPVFNRTLTLNAAKSKAALAATPSGPKL